MHIIIIVVLLHHHPWPSLVSVQTGPTAGVPMIPIESYFVLHAWVSYESTPLLVLHRTR